MVKQNIKFSNNTTNIDINLISTSHIMTELFETIT